MVCPFHYPHTCILDGLFNGSYMGTLRIVFHLHAGAKMDHIHILPFQGLHQSIHPSARTASAGKESYHFSIFTIVLKMDLTAVKSFKATRTGTGLGYDVACDHSYSCYFFISDVLTSISLLILYPFELPHFPG